MTLLSIQVLCPFGLGKCIGCSLVNLLPTHQPWPSEHEMKQDFFLRALSNVHGESLVPSPDDGKVSAGVGGKSSSGEVTGRNMITLCLISYLQALACRNG